MAPVSLKPLPKRQQDCFLCNQLYIRAHCRHMSKAPFGDHAQEMQVTPLPCSSCPEMPLVRGDSAHSRNRHSRKQTNPLHMLHATSLHGEGNQASISAGKPSWQCALNGSNPPLITGTHLLFKLVHLKHLALSSVHSLTID